MYLDPRQVKGPYSKCVIGRGAEGTVQRIGENIVKKEWFGPLFLDRPTTDGLLARFRQIRDAVQFLPEQVRAVVRFPEFLGYEGRVEDGTFVSYHEYIEGVDTYNKAGYALTPEDRHALSLCHAIDEVYADAQRDTNLKIKDGKIYLIDVAVSQSYRTRLNEVKELAEMVADVFPEVPNALT